VVSGSGKEVNEMSMEKTTNTVSTPDLKQAVRELLNDSVVLYSLVRTVSSERGDRKQCADVWVGHLQ
jgi:hypothetical protein